MINKYIWSCWFQGEDAAPPLVRACLESWRLKNPDWEVRCLDAETVLHYVDLESHIDTNQTAITAASLSDIVRLLLLNEYGGVWVDATLFCQRPLDDWLESVCETGFFAFARPAPDRELSTWFLAAEAGNPLLGMWAKRAMDYWKARRSSDDYFWVHHEFNQLVEAKDEARRQWALVPKVSADGPHSVQTAGFHSPYADARSRVDWTAPVFKLTYRYKAESLDSDCLLYHVLDEKLSDEANIAKPYAQAAFGESLPLAQLKVGTQNLGDHIQIISGARLLARAGLKATYTVDRDDEIAMPPECGPMGILLNGWFKTNPAQWPPHSDFHPIYLGFHIRLFQAPSLVSLEAISHYKVHEPIGCRDVYTSDLLNSHGVLTYVSHCLTLTYPRRLPDPDTQNEIFVVSRDTRLCDYIPHHLGPYAFINHYSDSNDFEKNMKSAERLLETYKSRAKLIVTTLLHCALPAIAMGIPVVMFYPINDKIAHQSDRERFSSLQDILPIYDLSELERVDWNGATSDVSSLKLALIENFFKRLSSWHAKSRPKITGIAPSSVLPPPM